MHIRRVFPLFFVLVAAGYAQSRELTNGNSHIDNKAMLQEAHTAARQVHNDFQRGLLLDEIGALEARLREYQVAIATARSAYPNTLKTLDTLGREIAQDHASAAAVISRLNSNEASTVLANMASAEAEKGDIQLSRKEAYRISAPEVRSEVLRELASHQCAAGDAAGAHKSIVEANLTYPAQKTSSEDETELIADCQVARGDKDAARRSIDAVTNSESRGILLASAAESLRKAGDIDTSRTWLQEAFDLLSQTPAGDFVRYMAIPTQVRLGGLESAVHFAASQSGDMRMKAYGAIAVTCAEEGEAQGLQRAIDSLRTPYPASRTDADLDNFPTLLQLLNVAAALIDKDKLQKATELVGWVEARMDEASKSSLEREIQLEIIAIDLRSGNLEHAKELAAQMPTDSVADIQRGNAYRLIAIFETKAKGPALAHDWAAAIHAEEDRGYALVGIVQEALGIADVELPYAAINVH